MQHNEQSGRSMIEMLGVLAVIGVLSVGAIVGYTKAMNNVTANAANDELRYIVFGIKDLYHDKANYDGISRTLLRDADIFPSDRLDGGGNPLNMFTRELNAYPLTFEGFPVFRLYYGIPPDNPEICRKILLSDWVAELGEDLRYITAYTGSSTESFRRSGGTYTLPVTVANAATACDQIMTLTFYIR